MDYQTLFSVLVSALLIQSLALILTWHQNRSEIGLRDWAYAGGIMALSNLLSAYGLNIEPSNPTASIVLRTLASTAGITGWILVWIGTCHFYGKATLRYTTLMLLMFLIAVILAGRPDPSWRIMLTSAGVVLFSALALREFLQRPFLHNPTLLLMIASLGFTCSVWLVRGLAHAAPGAQISFADSLALYAAIVASFAMTLSMIVLTNERINEELRSLASKDPLTGAMNRRAFYDASAPLLGALKRDTRKLSVCLLDIDHFKRINDCHGHAVGDQVLRQFSQIAQTSLREGDLFARYGGEEFAVLLQSSDPTQAEQTIERLRKAFSSPGINLPIGRLDVTFSAGISHASGPVGVNLDTLLNAADQSLYQAKNAGRDRIVVFPNVFSADQTAVVKEQGDRP